MASRMTSFQSKPNYLFPTHNPIRNSDGVFEFDEAELWVNPSNGSNQPAESKKMMSTIPRETRRKTMAEQKGTDTVSSASLPVNIPDWSKILKEQRKQRDVSDEDVDNDYENGDEVERVPPHEYLARNRGASFSVHEGIGRTLKGRDLRRVRNAIWKQVGFED
ncbi:putative senescence regulator S40 [Rosa chinensis]|uniref:Putative senescence regulator S40 n=1 Tax=Rosa chinensis TaxID=74649 RepID=A0A2P6RAT6_ROSCH|nr:uncharacterized protein LOC112192826 [Rosa chinensis]PRQ43542.1 putative senescence regulator S40 [Rosa chinensis]